MSLTSNLSDLTIWAIEHSSDNIWLLELLLEKWGYRSVRIQDREILQEKVDPNTDLPSLIIISIAPLQKNVLQLISYFRQQPTLKSIPIFCLCPTGGLCESQVIAAGANGVLNKPFELEELRHRLQKFLGEKTDFKMTLLVDEIEFSSSVEQQQYWSQIFRQHSRSSFQQLLREAGYEVFE